MTFKNTNSTARKHQGVNRQRNNRWSIGGQVCFSGWGDVA
jgi:hypothetical protein